MRDKLVLLSGQTVALGLTMAFLVVPASSLFLSRYGADRLPYVYLGVAVAGLVVSSGMARAQRHWSLARLAFTLLSAFSGTVLAAWLGLVVGGAAWVTGVLLVLFPLAIPIGFVIIGGQAGRLLDVRQMKSHFPRVVAGFSVGFAIGGFGAAWLVGVLGGPGHLLGVDVLCGLLMLVLVAETCRRHPVELRVAPEPVPAQDTPSKSDEPPLLRNRLVRLTFGYQLLSAAVTQLLDYMVWERAAARYPDPDDLARFLGVFGAIINVASVVFVVALAGWLLSRYGLGLGLAANPAGVLVLLAASVAVGYAGGPATTVFFVLVCAQQVTDIALTDGTTRTSINATYQALPLRERLRAQTGTEGAGVPLALGLVGVILLVADALGLDVRVMGVLTLVLSVGWLALAVLTYREYGVALRGALSQRSWDPLALRVEDEATRTAIAELLRGDLRDVEVGLAVLTDAEDPGLGEHVTELLTDPDPARVSLAISTIYRAGLTRFSSELHEIMVDPARTSTVRLHAAAALVHSDGPASGEARAALAEALRGDDSRMGDALVAASAEPDPFFVPFLIALAGRPIPPEGLSDALVAHADHLVDANAFATRAGSSAGARVLRAVAGAGTERSRELLVELAVTDDRDVSEVALRSLVAHDRRAGAAAGAVTAAVDRALQRAARALDALGELGEHPGAEHLRRALRDEVVAAGERAAGLLSLLHGPAALSNAVTRLASDDAGRRALALETLEVTLGRATTSLLLAVTDPTIDDAERRRRLGPLGVPHLGRDARLRELVTDPERHWDDPWLRACALLAMQQLLPDEAGVAAARLAGDPDPVVQETAAWVVAESAPAAEPLPGQPTGPTAPGWR